MVINEIHHDPDVKTELVEFIELFNAGNNIVTLDGWSFSDGVSFTIPPGTSLPAGGYLVVAQNPAAVQAKFGVSALGPWVGTLANEGEKIALCNAAGGIVDEVDYQLGFPWPTVGDSPGYSIELVNPAFDNNLGGHWRVSVAGNPVQGSTTLFADHGEWRYFKGTSEASTPTTTWRAPGFDDSGWLTGNGPIGYGENNFLGTLLSDMRYSYSTVFFRKFFTVADVSQVAELTLEAVYDDGFKVWINGVNVLNPNMSSSEVPFDGTSGPYREDLTYNTFVLSNPQAYLVSGTNVIAVQAANTDRSTSSDFFFDARLLAVTGPASHGPTPGALNSVYATNLPPAIRQVDHKPNVPTSGQPVTVTAKVTDPQGVANVTLRYQLVDPGSYIALTDAAYTNNWTSMSMNDAGLNGDALAGDSVYTAVLPGSLLTHRRLIRYRIASTDGSALSVSVPYADDPQPNFALFCYDGVPAWQGAVRPGITPVLTFDTNEMRRLPVLHLLSKSNSVVDATWFSRYGGDAYLWSGTLVYDGRVYDHVHYRARGGVWRYAMVKNMWKFDFNRGHDFQMRDDYGCKYKTRWTKLNLGASIQQGDYQHRGEQGMFESAGFRFFNLAGVEAPRTTFLQFRVISTPSEVSPASQYEGDFWGVYLAIEQEDGRFLDEHDLPDGNFYKMEGGSGELNNLGPLGPVDKFDLNSLLNNYTGATDDWWRANWALSNYYSYQAIVQAIHHYDINGGKNFFYYRYPDTGLWKVIPWDLDLTWAHNMYNVSWGGLNALASRILEATTESVTEPVSGTSSTTSNVRLTGARPAFELEFRNRVREIRDLLWNTDQAWQVIEELARLLRGTNIARSILEADRCMWDYNPKLADSTYSSAMSKAGQGRFYQWPLEAAVSRDFNGCIQLMRNYVNVRGQHLDSLAADALIPATPVVSYIGPPGHPLNRLNLRCTDYAGSQAFTAVKWRVAEVTDTNAPVYDPAAPRAYEITAAWESEALPVLNRDMTIPSSVVKIGRAYRARVRMKDVTGRWSRWSAPLQFVVGEPDNAATLADHLRVSEVMFDPPTGSAYEFVELHNLSTNLSLDLNGVNFTAGIDFTFPTGITLPPDSRLVMIKTTEAAFRAQYGLAPGVPLAGPFSGSLANNGEKLELKTGAGGTAIFSFDYGDGRGWPVAAAGGGHSLVPLDRARDGQATGALDYPGNWRASTFIGGSPGGRDPSPVPPSVTLNEIAAHTDYSNPAKPEYDSNDWIELHNRAATQVSLAGWFLSDDPTDLRKWAIPAISLPAGGRVSFDEVTGFHSPITSGFGLNKGGEQVLLSHLPGTAEDRVVDAIKFKGQENEVSLGRYPDGEGDWFTLARTRDTANTASPEHLVITELMYHPPDTGTNDNTAEEFIELLNPTATTVNLFTTNSPWRLDGGVGFTFPGGFSLPAGGMALIVNFDVADVGLLAAFRARFGITNLNLPILGPYSGKLGNRSDRVALETPQFPDLTGEPYSWMIEDEVIYGNQNPWPSAANGGGVSLHRAALNGNGNNPVHWYAAAPTAGLPPTTDRDGDGMPDAWEVAYQLDPENPNDATWDDDADGSSNLQEYRAGTDPRDKASVLRFTLVTAQADGVRLHFPVVAGRSYAVEVRNELAAAWTPLAAVPAGPTNGQTSVLDSSATNAVRRFYRLVTPASP